MNHHMGSVNLRRAALAVAVTAVATACDSTTVQIVRAPFISPIVVPAPDRFKMNVAVKNFSKTKSPALHLLVKVEYKPNVATSQAFVTADHDLSVPALDPDSSWAVADFEMSTSTPCVKGSCEGHVWLTLSNSPLAGHHLKGPNTQLHVSWDRTGDLAKMTIQDLGSP